MSVRAAMAAERRGIVRALAIGVVVALSTAGLSLTSAWLIVRAWQRPAVLSLSVPMGLVQIFALAKAATRYAERTATHRVALSVMSRVRADLAREIEPLVPAGLGPRPGEVVELALNDVDRVESLLVAVAAPLAAGTVAALVVAVVLGLLVPLAGLALAVALLVALGAGPVSARLAARAEERRDAALAALAALVDDLVRDPAAVALGEGCASALARLDEHEDALDRARRTGAWVRALTTATLTATSGLAAAAIVALSAAARAGGHLGAALVAVPALGAIAAPDLVGGAAGLTGWRADRASLVRLAALRDRPVPVVEPERPRGVVPGDLVARAVGVTGRLAPTDLAASTGVLALAGPSGSGKTTLGLVLAKFLDPDAGRLTLGGVDVADLTSTSVREVVGSVGDQPHVFATSLAGNLRLARPDARDGDLREVLERVGLADLLARPGGLDAPLGGASVGLSGGERARLGLARALLGARAALVVDEPTASLDEVSAERVRASLAAYGRDHAVVLISHRPEDLAVADRVVRLTPPPPLG